MKSKAVYACEVAIHLVTGLQYNKNSQPDNVRRLTAKFSKDIAYVRKNFGGYSHEFMLWSPIVRNQKAGSKHNQISHVTEIVQKIETSHAAKIELVINKRFQDALNDLRRIAGTTTKELDSSVMRYLQVEGRLEKHLRSAGMKLALTLPSSSLSA